MKKTLLLLLLSTTWAAYGQDKHDYIHFDELTAVEGTEFVIASVENRGKTEGIKNRRLLFINTSNGQSHQVDFPGDGYLRKIEQVKVDSLGINCILVSAQTVDLDDKNGIRWNDPTQIIVLSTDGKQKTQLTDSKLFVSTYAVNKTTGTIVVAGHYDTNTNGKYDKTDQDEIGIYDLKTLKLVSKI